MIIDLSNVKENSFLGEGKHLVKIIGVEKVTTEWNTDSLKITFTDKDGFIFNEFFPLEEKFLWKLKALAKAVDALDENQNLDTNNLLNRYLYITIGTYKSKNGNEFLTIKKFEKSKLNEEVAKTQPKQANNTQTTQEPQIPSIDIDDDEIPF